MWAVPRSHFDELVTLAEENDGLVTAEQARHAGFTDSVLARLAQRGRIERTARGVYRIPYYPPGRFSHYREAVLWAKANRGPQNAALSRATALVIYGISDANPSAIHLTVPKSARLRRQRPKGVVVHREDLTSEDVTVQEGVPVTTISRTIADLLRSGGRIDLVRQAISDARREGFINHVEARQLRRRVDAHIRSLKAAHGRTEPAR
jgi:predicted transcriptional regulator of viral defense system